MHPADPELPAAIRQRGEALRQGLPGYAGYQSPAERRSSDEALRRLLESVLPDFRLQLASLREVLAGQTGQRQRADDAGTRLEALLDRIQLPPYAYAPLFTVDWLPDGIQERLLGNDEAVHAAATDIVRFLEPTLQPGDDFRALLDQADLLIRQVDAAIDDRTAAIVDFH